MIDQLCACGAYSEADAARLVREVASALAFLHGIGIVHGDLKLEACSIFFLVALLPYYRRLILLRCASQNLEGSQISTDLSLSRSLESQNLMLSSENPMNAVVKVSRMRSIP